MVSKTVGGTPRGTSQGSFVPTDEPQMPPPRAVFLSATPNLKPSFSWMSIYHHLMFKKISNTHHLRLRVLLRKVKVAEAFQNSDSESISLHVFQRGTLHILFCLQLWFWWRNDECQGYVCSHVPTGAYIVFFYKGLLPALKPPPESRAVRTKTLFLRAVRVRRKANGTKQWLTLGVSTAGEREIYSHDFQEP